MIPVPMEYPFDVVFKYAKCEKCNYEWAPCLRFNSDEQTSADVECPECGCQFSIPRDLVQDAEKVFVKDLEAKFRNWKLDCQRCNNRMEYMGLNRLVTDTDSRRFWQFMLGDLAHLLAESSLNMVGFRCPECGKVEFFMPKDPDQYLE